jgi:hypothetical protein
MDPTDDGEIRASSIDWDFRRDGRSWDTNAYERYQLTPEKFEMYEGKLFWSEEQRLILLGLLLENVGLDAAVRLGDPGTWREVIAALGE